MKMFRTKTALLTALMGATALTLSAGMAGADGDSPPQLVEMPRQSNTSSGVPPVGAPEGFVISILQYSPS